MEDSEPTRQRNSGKVQYEQYTRERLDSYRQLIEKFQQQDRQKRYSISVDGELIVPPTTDPESFDDYLDFIYPHTQTVEIRLYFGESPNSNRYVFNMHSPSLAGITTPAPDVSTLLEQALEKQRLETRILNLETELKRKRKKLKNYRGLQAELDDKQIDIEGLLTKGMELYGQFKSPKSPIPVHGLPSSEVHIEAELTEVDKLINTLKEQCSEKELERAIKTWEILTKYPELRQEFTALIQAKNKNDG